MCRLFVPDWLLSFARRLGPSTLFVSSSSSSWNSLTRPRALPPSLPLSPRRKPDPAFFRLALERVGVAADEAVFLDDIGHNLAAARKLGMHTIRASLLSLSLCSSSSPSSSS